MKTETEVTCPVQVFSQSGSFRGHRCGNRVIVIRDGKSYCGIHDPGDDKQTWWYVGRSDDEPRAAIVTKATSKTLIINGNKNKKVTEYGTYYPTRLEALHAMAKTASNKRKAALAGAERADNDIIRINAMLAEENSK